MENRQPNSHHCFVCGLQNPFGLQLHFYDNGEDEVRCEYSIPDRYQGYPGIAHGGIVAAILDEVFTKAHKRLLAMQIADILEEKQLTKSELANWTDLKTTTDFFLTYVTRRRCNLTPHPERLL